MLDAHLARLYGVSTKAFNQAVRRNRSRFPGDFLFELTNQEVTRSRSHIVTLKSGRARAEQMSVYVVRAFVKLRESLAVHTELARELATLKSRGDTLDVDTRNQFDQVYEASSA